MSPVFKSSRRSPEFSRGSLDEAKGNAIALYGLVIALQGVPIIPLRPGFSRLKGGVSRPPEEFSETLPGLTPIELLKSPFFPALFRKKAQKRFQVPEKPAFIQRQAGGLFQRPPFSWACQAYPGTS